MAPLAREFLRDVDRLLGCAEVAGPRAAKLGGEEVGLRRHQLVLHRFVRVVDDVHAHRLLATTVGVSYGRYTGRGRRQPRGESWTHDVRDDNEGADGVDGEGL